MVMGLLKMWREPSDRRLFIATVPVLTLGVMGRSDFILTEVQHSALQMPLMSTVMHLISRQQGS